MRERSSLQSLDQLHEFTWFGSGTLCTLAISNGRHKPLFTGQHVTQMNTWRSRCALKSQQEQVLVWEGGGGWEGSFAGDQ